MSQPLTIALSKGRILKDTLPLLADAGIIPTDDLESRRLILRTNQDDVRLLVVRATDVPTYVEYGAADLGVTGKDVLLEHGGEGLYEPLDLRIACCRLAVAVPTDVTPPQGRMLRVATKYVRTTHDYYAARGEQVEIIKLYGSMELAPLVGLADHIVDLVETGSTLRANGLEPRETVCEISTRLVVNKASMKIKHARIKALIARLTAAVDARNPRTAKG